jgi:thimet oligopeptidase
MNNPLLYALNEPVRFADIALEHLPAAEQAAVARTQAQLQQIYQVPAAARTFTNTMLAYDELLDQLGQTTSFLFLLMSVCANAPRRDQARASVEALEKFGNQLALDEDLYRAVKEYAQTPEAAALGGWQAKFLHETVRNFERDGFALPKPERDELKKLQDQLTELGNQFYKHIAEHQDELVLTEAEMAGLPADYQQARRRDDGSYTVGLDYPSYQPFMQYAHNAEARKQLYIKFLNRAKATNLPVLADILRLRRQVAQRLGYPTYAAYRQAVLMAKQPRTVWDFENDLWAKVRPKAQADYQELLQVKQGQEATAQALMPWEQGYYRTQLLRDKYSVDHEQIKEYFPLDRVLDGLFAICGRLFGIEFTEVPNAPLWHPEARYFEVREAGQLLGRLYLDLFPREHKYNHAACFPLIQSRQTAQGRQLPVLALICNFTPPTPGKPARLRHSEVETMFHEFGHALHVLLSTSPVGVYAGTNTVRDFVEVPSQLLENWAWHYDSLQLFARHWQTDEVLPRSLSAKMLAAKNVGAGLHVQQQIFYGSFDLTLHDGYDPDGPETTTDVLRRLQNQLTLVPYVEGTHFQAAFGHLTGYAASYYSYLWSLVYAEDMFGEFAQQGILQPQLGQKYRQTVLAKGGSEDELGQVVAFLGRPPQAEAFIRSLGL